MTLACGSVWRPTRVERVIETFGTSTRPAKVMTDKGLALLKGMGNPAGDAALACEVVAGELAVALGLRVPAFAIASLNLPITMNDHGPMAIGPAFLSEWLPGQTLGAEALLNRITRPGDIAKLVFLDSWIRNEDRYPPVGGFNQAANWDNLFFTPAGRDFDLVALDHSHCFTLGDLCDEIGDHEVASDTAVYGLFPQFAPFLTEAHVMTAAAALAEVSGGLVDKIINQLPEQWGIGPACGAHWANVIRHRAALVAQALPAALLAQPSLKL